MQKPLGEILKEMELITDKEIKEALAIQKKQGGSIGKILVEKGYITEEELLLALSIQTGIECVNFDDTPPTKEALAMIQPSTAKMYNIMPVSVEDGVLKVAVTDPNNLTILDDLRMLLNCEVEPLLALEADIRKAWDKFYGSQQNVVASMLKGLSEDLQNIEAEFSSGGEVFNLTDARSAAESAPVIKLLNLYLAQAIRDRAADIHFEPFGGYFRVRYKVDGLLRELSAPSLALAQALTARIKVMAKLDVTETRLPQDGKIVTSIEGRQVDIRVSTLPTRFGESSVLRILDKGVVSLNLESLGLRDEDLNILLKLLDLPHGIILVTGPTGSGKTTTLYACLNKLNQPRYKIITTEDPVEYDIDGLVQCEIHDDIGLTYAAALRVILRQDPDIILVGEMRDKETAEIAVEAALTGHQVFSTLHTNDAPSTIIRLVDLGIEPFLIAATVEAIIAQRLVRRICLNCKTEFDPTDEQLYELNLKREDLGGKKLFYGKGCSMCNNTGYKGRMAIYEIMVMSERIKQLVLERAPIEKIRSIAREEGMRTLRESALLALFDGLTTIEEVVRETISI
jgi:type IV pilus assembly protein PilB